MTVPGEPSLRRLAADEAGLAEAAALLRTGRLVAFPTETVYGLGADATDPQAVARLYAAKGRPHFNPLIAHLPQPAAAFREGVFDADARLLAESFWPGPLTLVVPAAAATGVCDLARAGLASVALRVPAHPVAVELLAAVGCPVAAPSANRSGRVSPTAAAHVVADLGAVIDAVVDAGPCPVGLESTIIGCLGDGPRLLRAGGITRARIEAVLGRRLARPKRAAAGPPAPGMLSAHYAPRTPVRLAATAIKPGEAALLFGPTAPPGAAAAVASRNLSEAGDLTEAAANLYGHLHALDAAGARAIAVVAIPEHDLGEAINDRLRRAAAGR